MKTTWDANNALSKVMCYIYAYVYINIYIYVCPNIRISEPSTIPWDFFIPIESPELHADLDSRGLVLVGRITMGFHAKNWIHLRELFFLHQGFGCQSSTVCR